MVSRFSEQEGYNQTDTFAYSESGGGVLGELLGVQHRAAYWASSRPSLATASTAHLKDSAAAYMIHRSRQSAVLHEFSNPPVTFPENAQTQRNIQLPPTAQSISTEHRKLNRVP